MSTNITITNQEQLNDRIYIQKSEDGNVTVKACSDAEEAPVEVSLNRVEARELVRVLQGPLLEGDEYELSADQGERERTIRLNSTGAIILESKRTAAAIDSIVEDLVGTLLDWGVGFERPTGPSGETLTHDDREICVEDLRLYREIGHGYGDGGDVRVYCPVCGRIYDHVYDHIGLWDVDEDEYVYRSH